MTIKEKPLIDAMSRPDPLPGFLTASPVVAGAFGFFMSAVFGVVLMLLNTTGRGVLDETEVLFWLRVGGYGGLVLAGLMTLGVLIRGFEEKEERPVRLGFLAGGVLMIILLTALDIALGPRALA